MKVHVYIALLLTVGVSSNAQNRAGKLLPDPHHHVLLLEVDSGGTDLASDVKILPMSGPARDSRDSLLSPNGYWRAFIFSAQGEWARLSFEDTRTGKRCQVVGLPLPHRPISDLIWIDSTLLAFDRWSQPHYGMHYVLDVQQARLILAAPFPDEFYLRQQQDTLR
jgi:hypothetical protein